MMSKGHANPIQAQLRPIGVISGFKASRKVTNTALLVHGGSKPVHPHRKCTEIAHPECA